MQRLAQPLFLALLLAGCAGKGSDWPSLNPRPGEISPMVPRNVPGLGRCPRGEADCAPPTVAVTPAAPDMPAPAPPPTLATIETELAALEDLVAGVEAAAAPARAARDAARAAAAGSAPDSTAALALEAAESALAAALAPLATADYRRAALADGLRDVPGADTVAPRLAALADRIAALRDQ